MKRKALAIVLTLLMLVSVLPMGAFAASYTDTEGHWAEKSIDRWTDAKVLEGMGNNTYAPDENLTRAQAMTIFSRLLKLTEKGDISKLTDVAADAWYAPYIETGYAYEIIKGTSDTTFDPTGEITREQFFSIFARAVGMNLGAEKATSSNKDFTDLDSISDWAKEEGAVYAMINAGYVNGYPDGSLKPLRNITRAEVAKILDNAISDYITENGTYDLTGHNGIVIVTAPNVKLTGDFNGLIVSSCPDSTLDLSSIKGKPHVHILGDNTKIINAPVGTRITISPAADNVTVNNKKYNPRADFIVGASGGGGSTPTVKNPKYVVRISVTDLANLNADPEVVGYLYNETATSKEVFDAVSAGFAATSKGFENIANQLKGTDEGDVKIADDGTITVATKDGVTFTQFLSNLDARYINHMSKAAPNASLQDAFKAFAEATKPSQLVAGVKVDGATAQTYAATVFSEVGKLVAAIQDSGTNFSQAQYADMMKDVFNFIGMKNEDVDKLAGVLADTTKSSDAVIDSTKNASKVTYVELSGNIADAAEAIAQLGSRLDASYAGTDGYSQIAQSIMKAAVDGTSHFLQGDYHVIITVEPYAG